MRRSSVSVFEMPVVSLLHPYQPAFAEPEELQYVWEKCRAHGRNSWRGQGLQYIVKLQFTRRRMNAGLHICPQVTWGCSLISKRWQKDHGEGRRKAKSVLYIWSKQLLFLQCAVIKYITTSAFLLPRSLSFLVSLLWLYIFFPLTFFSVSTHIGHCSLSSLSHTPIYQN